MIYMYIVITTYIETETTWDNEKEKEKKKKIINKMSRKRFKRKSKKAKEISLVMSKKMKQCCLWKKKPCYCIWKIVKNAQWSPFLDSSSCWTSYTHVECIASFR